MSQSEQNAVRSSFPNSKDLLCVFHVLQAVWHWLLKAKNGIPQQQQCEFFQSFKSIVHAQTKNEALKNYEIARSNIGEDHQNYLKYLEGYWQRRDQWAISHRIGLLIEGYHTNNISEAFMRIMKDKIFERVNLYFQRRLLHTANNADHKSFSRPIKVPSAEVLEKIKHVNKNILLVPSEEKLNHFYIVNMTVLLCTCVNGNMGKICKDVDWASTVFPSNNYKEAINTTSIRSLYYFIATNEAPPESWLEPLYGSQSEKDVYAGNVVQMEVDEANTDHTQEEVVDTVDKSVDEENNVMLHTIHEHLADFTKRSPEEMGKGKKLMEILGKMKTPSACASFLANFGEGKS